MTGRHLMPICVAVLLATAIATPAVAKPSLSHANDKGDQRDENSYSFVVTDGVPGTDDEYVAVAGETREPLFVISYRVLDTDPVTGEDCTRRRYILGHDEAERGPAGGTARLAEEAFADATGATAPPPCSGVTIDEGAPARTAAQLVADQLDPAAPYLQPDNQAITGLRSFLTTNLDSDTTRTVTVTLFGRDWDVEVHITGVHTVDWGDGTIDTGITGDGGPWHDGAEQPGDITHTYIDASTYDLVVRTDWTVTATLSATGVTATQTRSTTSTPVTIDVDEVRSVRDR